MRSTTIQELRADLRDLSDTRQAVKEALDFLDRKPDDVPVPNAQVCHDGSIGFYWRRNIGPLHAEIIFDGDGTCYSFGAHGKDADADIYTERGIDVDSGWPKGLRKILNNIDIDIGEK